MKNPQRNLPPGFRFHPTDEELILHYLKKKLASTPFPVSIIADVDIYKFDPWDLPAKAAFGEKEWYFFSPRDRKYPNGVRPNRAAASGYWKATGTDKVIVASSENNIIGVKKALVFYKGRPPKGVKTNWIMHEYRLYDSLISCSNKHMKPKVHSSMRLDDWVLCRIYNKTHAMAPSTITAAGASNYSDHEQEEEEEEGEKIFQETLLPLRNPICKNTLMPQKSSSFSNLLEAVDYSILSSLLSDHNQTTAHESNIPTLNSSASDQPFFNNYNSSSSSSSSNNSYLLQKLPQLMNTTSVPNMENKVLKRQLSNVDEEDTVQFQHHHPSKKHINSCSFINSTNIQTDHNNMGQYYFLHQPFLNQQLFLNSPPHLQFQG